MKSHILSYREKTQVILTNSGLILTEGRFDIYQRRHELLNSTSSRLQGRVKEQKFLSKQRPGVGGVAVLPHAASQIPGKYLRFLVTRATEKQQEGPEYLVLSLARLRDFLVERRVKKRTLASSAEEKQRTTESSGAVRINTRNYFGH